MTKRFTGLLDKNAKRIYEGDTLRVGMLRGSQSGWSGGERVVRKYSRLRGLFKNEKWSEWCLEDKLGQRMDMQLDQELREIESS